MVVSLDNLGDLVFAASLVPALKSGFPRAFVSLWCKRYTADIAALIPGLDACHAADPFWDRSPGRGKGRLPDFIRSWQEIRRSRYQTALVASRSSKTAAAVALAGIPKRIGFDRAGSRRWLTHCVAPAQERAPVLKDLSRLLEPLSLTDVRLVCSLDAAPLARERERLKTAVLPRTAALHPFAGALERRVPLAQWTRLAQLLESRGRRILWFGTAAELAPLRALAGPARRWLYLDQAAGASLREAAAALSLCEVFAGHDSGPLHLACALGVSCLGVYAPGEPKRTLPQGIGPWKMLYRPRAQDIQAEDMLRELSLLLPL